MNTQMQAVAEIDLEPIMVKLMDPRDGECWKLERAKAVAEQYRRFLALCLKYPDRSIVPYGDLDIFWHYHILDTAKYAADCEAVFGYFLHHFPYLGMRGPEDAENLKRAFAETQALFQEEFGVPYGEARTGAMASSCSGSPCGNRCTNRKAEMSTCDPPSATVSELMARERPRLAEVP